MKLSTRHRMDTDFSMSSMTDIVFLLLIFFMLTATAVTPQSLQVHLPASSSHEPVIPDMTITLTQELLCYVDGESVALENLPTVLPNKLLHIPSGKALLQIDKSVAVEHMVYITDLLASLHVSVSVATRSNKSYAGH